MGDLLSFGDAVLHHHGPGNGVRRSSGSAYDSRKGGKTSSIAASEDLLSEDAGDEAALGRLDSAVEKIWGPVHAPGNRQEHFRAEFPEAPLTKQWAQQRKVAAKGHTMNICQGVFIVSHEPELAEGLIEAVHKELPTTMPGALTGIRGVATTKPYVHVSAMTETTLMDSLRLACTLADEIVRDEFSTTGEVLIEVRDRSDAMEVWLEPAGVNNHLAATVRRDGIPLPAPKEQKLGSTYTDEQIDVLTKALKRAGSLNNHLGLRIELGHYQLASFQKEIRGPFTEGQFTRLVRNPRMKWTMNTRLCGAIGAVKLLKVIRKQKSPFNSATVMTTSATDERPDFVFEARSADYRFEAGIAVSSGDKSTLPCKMGSLNAFKLTKDTQSASGVHITAVCIDRRFDWKIGTTDGKPEKQMSVRPLAQFLQSSKIKYKPEGDEAYPEVILNGGHPIGANFNQVSVISVWKFAYKNTSYNVEVSLRRTWKSIGDMSGGKVKPDISHGVSICAEHWQGATFDVYGASDELVNEWDDELGCLFYDESATPAADANERVRRFLEIFDGMRSALEAE